MTDAYFYPRWLEQEGWTDHDATAFQVNYFGGMGVEANREFILRFFDVDIPSGATITAAYLVYYVYAKNDGDAQSITYDLTYEATAIGGTTIRQDATPLRIGVAEELTANRTWGANHITGGVFNWNTSAGDDQPWQMNVTTLIQQAINTNAGRHMTLAFKTKITAETGDMGIGNNTNDHKAALLIQYTGGTARNEVVEFQGNSNLTLLNPTGGAPALWFNNSAYGTYSDIPTYTTASTLDGITAPYGGNVFRITAADAKRVVAFHRPANDPVIGQWYCFSAFVYVPSGVPDVRIASFQSLFTDQGRVSTKDAWVRIYSPYIMHYEALPTFGIASVDPMAVGQKFYIANVNFTKGNHLYPYFDGNTADSATYHRTFEWGGGTTGKRVGGVSYVVLDSAPTVTGIDPQPTMSTYAPITSRWNYSDTYGEAMSRFRTEIRKKRRP